MYQNVDSTGALGTGRVFVYVNGVLVAQSNKLTNEPIVPDVPRPLAYLGRSCYASDGLMNGTIDSFRIFDRALTGGQVNALYYNSQAGCPITITATPTIADPSPNGLPAATTAPVPFFSVEAATDPRPAVGLTERTALYGWKQEDQGDVLCGVSQYHQGLIEFNGGQGTDNLGDKSTAHFTANFINLSASTGPNSIGTTLGMFGGAGSGSLADGSAGWSVEVTFRPGLQATWGKLVDLAGTRVGGANGPPVGDIVFGWSSSTEVQSFQLYDGASNTYGNTDLAPVQAGQWYHVRAPTQAARRELFCCDLV